MKVMEGMVLQLKRVEMVVAELLMMKLKEMMELNMTIMHMKTAMMKVVR